MTTTEAIATTSGHTMLLDDDLVRGEAELNPAEEDKILNQLVPLLQVGASDTKATPGSGGTPRREAAPALPIQTR